MKCAVAVLTGLVALGCEKAAPPEPSPPTPAVAAPSPAVAQPAPAAEKPSGSLVWNDPAGWSRDGQRSTMRVATYKVPRASGDGEDAELAVFYFGPGGAGGIEANVGRWTRQFKDLDPSAVKRSERTANGFKQHIVEVERGTFESGMPGTAKTAKDGYGMIAAIVEAPAGPYFFKVTGPSATLSASRDTLFTLLDSVKVGEK